MSLATLWHPLIRPLSLFLFFSSVGESALELMRRRSTLKPIVSLCEQLDTLMGGGIPIGQITEFCGVPGAGKCWGKDTAFMMFDGTTKLVQSIQEGDQVSPTE